MLFERVVLDISHIHARECEMPQSAGNNILWPCDFEFWPFNYTNGVVLRWYNGVRSAFSTTTARLVLQESLANAKVSARQPWAVVYRTQLTKSAPTYDRPAIST